ncbi:hypothetical protein EXE10_04190 [Acinetobacter sp. WCHAc060033]|uniref:Uncharacterized protein n=1 Tax=Acinetobacter wuhouensis TaxID=1879050 RepID=A0A3G2T2Z9_9GAMM|nr:MULTISPECIES: hypothetical protein [Acinetobacter]AYO54578.1 hypothetical protein CDG68_13400 [Acinetobacter wuhouensis]RZG87527.1 hypothetical protein EXE10_04190 [Acinetobacter sp. WCHAc060033]
MLSFKAMEYRVKFLYNEKNVEESLFVEVNGLILNIFCSEYNYIFKPLEVYEVELEFQIFNEYQIAESNLQPQFRKIDQSFSYEMIGLLENGVVTVGDFKIFDEILLSDYGYLDGKNISWIVDRIDLSVS